METGPASAKLLYRFHTTALPVQLMRVKVEINTREHFSVDGLQHVLFAVANPWHFAQEPITTFTAEELLATKMRALFQRRKGRDLYDLFLAMPISWRGTLQQYAGRLHRLHDEKREAVIYDYVDPLLPVLARMWEKMHGCGFTSARCDLGRGRRLLVRRRARHAMGSRAAGAAPDTL